MIEESKYKAELITSPAISGIGIVIKIGERTFSFGNLEPK